MPTLKEILNRTKKSGMAQLRGYSNAMTAGAAPTLGAGAMYGYNRSIGKPIMGDPEMSWEDAIGAARDVYARDEEESPADVAIGEGLGMVGGLAGGLAPAGRELAGGLGRIAQQARSRPPVSPTEMGDIAFRRQVDNEQVKKLQDALLKQKVVGDVAENMSGHLAERIRGYYAGTTKAKPLGKSPDDISIHAGIQAADMLKQGLPAKEVASRLGKMFSISDNAALALVYDLGENVASKEATRKAAEILMKSAR